MSNKCMKTVTLINPENGHTEYIDIALLLKKLNDQEKNFRHYKRCMKSKLHMIDTELAYLRSKLPPTNNKSRKLYYDFISTSGDSLPIVWALDIEEIDPNIGTPFQALSILSVTDPYLIIKLGNNNTQVIGWNDLTINQAVSYANIEVERLPDNLLMITDIDTQYSNTYTLV